MNPLNDNNDSDVAKYFKNLGYEYSWDYSRRDHLSWHEIYKGNELIIQVEMVPLKDIVRDMYIVEEIKTKYFLAGGPGENVDKNYTELCQKVRDFEKTRSCNGPVS